MSNSSTLQAMINKNQAKLDSQRASNKFHNKIALPLFAAGMLIIVLGYAGIKYYNQPKPSPEPKNP